MNDKPLNIYKNDVVLTSPDDLPTVDRRLVELHVELEHDDDAFERRCGRERPEKRHSVSYRPNSDA